MQLITLHLYDPEIAARYIRALQGTETPSWDWWQPDLPELIAADPGEAGTSRLSTGLARAMASEHPSFHWDGCGLTPWEAQFDRGVGMIMRPPARVFVDHGIDPSHIGSMPIRLDLQGGIMGGAWIPPHLIDNLDQLIDRRIELWAKRIHEADIDPYPLLATLRMATDAAKSSGLGLMEAINILEPGAQVIETPNRKKMNPELRQRIDIALEQEKQSLFGRLFKRGE